MMTPRIVRGYRRLDRALAARVLENKHHRAYPWRSVAEETGRRTGIVFDEMRGPFRGREITYARHLLMYLLHELCWFGPNATGALLGGRDHSTVIAGVKRIASELTTRPETVADVDAIRLAVRERAA